MLEESTNENDNTVEQTDVSNIEPSLLKIPKKRGRKPKSLLKEMGLLKNDINTDNKDTLMENNENDIDKSEVKENIPKKEVENHTPKL